MIAQKCLCRLTCTVLLISLQGCRTYQPSMISGLIYERHAVAHAQVRILDAEGRKIMATTNTQGIYRARADALTPPILVSAVAEGDAENCSDNSTLRPLCMTALLLEFPSGRNIIANVNPLTDRMVSDIAIQKGFIGPQQWVDSNTVGKVDAHEFNRALKHLRDGFSDALAEIGITPITDFNPAKITMTDTHPLTEIFSLIHHNRNYDNNSGATGHTVLTDFGFRPIVGLVPFGAYEKFDLQTARQHFQRTRNAALRIFIVGDSTSAVYEKVRYPRMGWGQAFAQIFNAGRDINIVVGSRAGRSSRDFYNGRWFAQMEDFIKPGDYVIINHGHNDQNCNSAKPVRGAADVKNLCTYPNNDRGEPQHPIGKPELSFQHSLEKYIRIARAKGARPVLLTPTARIRNKHGEQTTPVVHSHVTRQNPGSRFLWTGDYSQTIRTTAELHKVPLIDLETASINFANRVGDPGWKNYWLAVDPTKYPFYENAPGSIQQPDGTHFQKAGAEAIAYLVAEEIRRHAKLQDLAIRLFNENEAP